MIIHMTKLEVEIHHQLYNNATTEVSSLNGHNLVLIGPNESFASYLTLNVLRPKSRTFRL